MVMPSSQALTQLSTSHSEVAVQEVELENLQETKLVNIYSEDELA